MCPVGGVAHPPIGPALWMGGRRHRKKIACATEGNVNALMTSHVSVYLSPMV